jgi:hypothetical protein
MRKQIKTVFALCILLSSCSKDETNKIEEIETGFKTPLTAFEDFNSDSVTISIDNDQITIETNGLPNHTSPYWEETHPLYVEPIISLRQTPGKIGAERSLTLTVPTYPNLASNGTTTGLGPIGISVTGVPIFNDLEGPNGSLGEEIAATFDYAGAHNGPSGYHYHIESFNIPENTVLSHDDEKLIGVMSDGFLLYGRKCNSTNSHPSDLDSSGGHISGTQHSSENETFYHYHVLNEYFFGNVVLLFGQQLLGVPNAIL